ncbi:alpha/beta hydrolase [Roseomonas sp. GC11]|uniref:lipase family protein n=1 Tax=Roseomonas sp. GC11 TaxID=2950546 RepID=UPI00210CE932|nr:lipase family protein [Roseomonas sp. GC11]MCQ4158483.1 alpha/beta hydrolase [Roseomonas sp. GC11]
MPLLALCLAACTTGPAPGEAAAEPGISPFYHWEAALDGPPGHLLRTEPLPQEKGIAQAGSQRRILYSSRSGLDGRPIAVSGLLFLPPRAPPAGGWPLLAWGHAVVGVGDACAPSWTGASPRAERYLGAWLEAGFAIVVSDFEGLGTPGRTAYLDRRAEAQSLLDAARAVIGEDFGIANQVVIGGQSQGGAAALAAGALAPAYAPELAVKAVLATGAPAPAPAPAPAGDAAAEADLSQLFYLVQGARGQRRGLAPERLFTPLALPLAESAATACMGTLATQLRMAGLGAGAPPQAVLRPGAEAALAPLLADLAYPSLRLPMPVFLGIGAADREAAPERQRALARAACAAGTRVQARLYAGEDHQGAWMASQRDALAFARQTLRDAPVVPDCDPAPRHASTGPGLTP